MDYRIDEPRRFRVALGGLCAALCMSVFYGFNLISNHLQKEYGLGGDDLTTITTTGIIIGFVTFPGGMLLDYAGPMWVNIIATTLCALGCLLFGLAFDGVIAGSTVRFAVFCSLTNFGCTSFDTGSLMAVLGSFPLARGPLVALTKTLTGLGASVLSAINYGFFRDRYAAYMYFLTCSVVFLGTVASVFIRFPPYHIVDWEKSRVPEETQRRRRLIEPFYLRQRPPMRRLVFGICVILALIIYLTAQSLCVAYIEGISDETRMGITIGALLILLSLSLIAAPLPFLGGTSEPSNEQLPPLPDASKGTHQPPDAPESEATVEGVEEVANEAVDPQYQKTFWEDLRTPDLWLMWWHTMATWGCGLVISLNSAQIYRALNDNVFETKTNVLYSTIIGVGSALGRLTIGILEAVIIRRDPNCRPAITCLYPIASCSLVLGLLFLLLLPLSSKAIVLGFFLDAFGNGATWASTALSIRTMYAKDIGKHYNFMYLGALISVVALNRFAYGEQFTQQARKDGTYPFCGGKACVRNALIILICINASAIAASILVHVRYDRYVKRIRSARCAKDPAMMPDHMMDEMNHTHPMSSPVKN